MSLYRWGNGVIVASMYVAFLLKIDVAEDTTYLLTFSGVLIAANVVMAVAVLLQTALLGREFSNTTKLLRVADGSVLRSAFGV